jgi:hypothetical protein
MDSPKLGLMIWVLIICGEVVAAVSLLRNFPDSQMVASISFGLLGVSFAGGLLVLLTDLEISIEDNGLEFRRRSLLRKFLKKPYTERRIQGQSINSFRVDKSPWTELILTILLDDGSRLRVRGRPANARPDGKFESFVTAFRLFAKTDIGHSILESSDVWQSPIRRALVGGIVIACGVSAVLFYRASAERNDLIIVAIGAIAIAVQGIRFLLKRDNRVRQ